MPKEAVARAPVPELLRDKEAAKLSAFFGEPISVPRAPQTLWKALDATKAARINIFSPHFLPLVKIDKDGKYPGWKRKPQDWFWEQLVERELDEASADLPGVWVLVDKSGYQRDPLEPMLGGLFESRYRKSDFPTLEDYDPRVDISADELDMKVYPEISNRLKLNSANVVVRSPRAIEFNFLGNLHYPEFGKSPNSIWLEDLHKSGSRLVSGNAKRGGLSGIDWRRPDQRYDVVGFRPMIVFAR